MIVLKSIISSTIIYPNSLRKTLQEYQASTGKIPPTKSHRILPRVPFSNLTQQLS